MRLLLLLFAIHCSLYPVLAQQPFYRDIPLTESGAPVRINDMVFDATGCLWLGTEQGLLRYNGRTATPEPPSSSRRPVSAVAAYGDALFVGFRDGNVMVLRDRKARRIFGTASSAINCLLPTPFGVLVGTAGEGIALVRVEGTYRLTTSGGLSDDYVYSIALTNRHSSNPYGARLLAGTDRGITVVSAEKDGPRCSVLNTTNTPNLGDNIIRVIRPLPGADNDFFVGTQAGGFSQLTRVDEDSWHVMRSTPWAGGQINDAMPVNNFQRAIASDGGLQLKEYNGRERALLRGQPIHRVACDASGNFWLATSTGLTMLTMLYLESLSLPPPYNLRTLSALTTDRAGTLWYAQDKTLYTYDTATGTNPRYSAPESITTLYADARNRLWIGTLGGGLLCMEKGNPRGIAAVENLRGGHILHIAGRGDTLWVSSLNGVEELYVPPAEPNALRALRHHGRASGAGSDYIYQLYPDRRGRLWMATDGAGLAMWDGRRYHRWDSSSGFAPRVVYSVVEDARGNIWAGTLEGGLLRWDGQTWKTFRREDGLQNNTILSLAALRDGSVVAVNESGADQWLPESSEFRQYSRRMGLHIDSFSTALNATATDAAGNVLVPYEHGFLVMKPTAQPPDFRPRISLRAVELFFKSIDTTRHGFSHDENGIGFRWEGIHFAAPERLRYRYRLRGYGQGWVETGDESITYPRLPPGRYIFEVEAALGVNFSRAAHTAYSFRIAAPLWKRWWFWMLSAAALVSIGYALIRRRDRARQRLATLQQARLRAEYEGLKNQVNPHFLFNSLNTLVNLIEEDPPAAAHYTEHLSDLYRATLSFRSRDVVTLGEEWAVLQKYLYIQQSRFGEALRLETDFRDDILRTGKIIPLALQLLVENAIKHNEVSRAHPLTIFIRAIGETIAVSNALQPKAAPEKSTGTGLENIRNRYALLTSRAVEVSKDGRHFTVILPML